MWDAILFWWALAALLFDVCFAWVLIGGGRRIQRLRDFPDRDQPQWPKVSIIVPARNEERHIREALQSMLALDYPDFEVIAVNDRSTDRTGEILDELARYDSRLRIEHVRELPPGWLGKNHALHAAAQIASGEFIFFTDADVFFEPRALRLAVHYCEQHDVDHLAAGMEVRVPGWLMKSFVLTFGMFFLVYLRPWKVSEPKSRSYVGIGAFNLVRTTVYHAVGGHGPIAMRPDDDVMLGKLIKMNGYRQDFMDAVGLIHVPWYASLGEMIRGLEKNQFAGVEYSIAMVVASSLSSLLAFVAPFVEVFFTQGPAQWMFAAAALVLWTVACGSAVAARLPLTAALAFPVSVLLFIYIQWRTMLLVLAHGGLQWRDTFYALSDLKANRLVWPRNDQQSKNPNDAGMTDGKTPSRSWVSSNKS